MVGGKAETPPDEVCHVQRWCHFKKMGDALTGLVVQGSPSLSRSRMGLTMRLTSGGPCLPWPAMSPSPRRKMPM